MKKRNLLALLLAAALMFTLAACGTAKPSDKVLVIGVDAAFDAKWNPFLDETYYDHQIVDEVFAAVCVINSKNELEDYAGSVKDEKQDDGSVKYTITIKKGMKYTDGTDVTIDDYIYGIYVRSDPSYTGPMSLLPSHIVGVEEYFYGNANYSADIKALEDEAAAKYATDTISFDDFLTYAKATNLDGWWDGDPAGDIGNGETWSDYANDCGYGDDLAAIDATNADQMFNLIAKIEYETSLDAYDTENWFLDNMKSDYAEGNVGKAGDVTEITGVKKVDDYTCAVTLDRVDITADRMLTTCNGIGNLQPRAYYGELKKGDVSAILANMKPIGSGPYIFQDYANNIVTCTANEKFFQGVPKTGTVRWQVIPTVDMVEAITSGAVDIANPQSSKDNVAEMKNNPQVRMDLIDNAGYGYMAMNCQNVPLLCRKAVWSLMNRQPSVEGWYGPDLAQVIERPMTTTLAEYPQDAQPFYMYSRDKALEYFQQAGYTQKDGKLVDANGNQFVINCYIGGQGSGAHPAFAMLMQAQQDLATLGGELQIQDVDMNVMMAAVDDGTADMWIMAWSAVYDCDKTDQWHTGGGQNKYRYSSQQMDSLLEQVTQTLDLTERRKLVSQVLDLAMDDCVEYPLYQRKNMICYNGDNVDLSTIPTATTAADYEISLWKVVVK